MGDAEPNPMSDAEPGDAAPPQPTISFGVGNTLLLGAAASNFSQGLAVGDLDNNGTVDLASVTESELSVRWFPGIGDGGFLARQTASR